MVQLNICTHKRLRLLVKTKNSNGKKELTDWILADRYHNLLKLCKRYRVEHEHEMAFAEMYSLLS